MNSKNTKSPIYPNLKVEIWRQGDDRDPNNGTHVAKIRIETHVRIERSKRYFLLHHIEKEEFRLSGESEDLLHIAKATSKAHERLAKSVELSKSFYQVDPALLVDMLLSRATMLNLIVDQNQEPEEERLKRLTVGLSSKDTFDDKQPPTLQEYCGDKTLNQVAKIGDTLTIRGNKAMVTTADPNKVILSPCSVSEDIGSGAGKDVTFEWL